VRKRVAGQRRVSSAASDEWLMESGAAGEAPLAPITVEAVETLRPATRKGCAVDAREARRAIQRAALKRGGAATTRSWVEMRRLSFAPVQVRTLRPVPFGA